MRHYGTHSSWTEVCKLHKEDSERSKAFKSFIAKVAIQAPVLLSHRQTKDAINSISRACGSSTKLSKALLVAILPDGTMSLFPDSAKEKQFLEDACPAILFWTLRQKKMSWMK